MGVNQTANPQQTVFALAQLQRLFGSQGTPYGVAPTSGPYNWAPQAEVGGDPSRSLDGTPLGGINLGYVNDIYGQNPDQAAGDARIREIFGSMFSGSRASPSPSLVNPQSASPQVPSVPAAAAPSTGASTSAQPMFPSSFAADLTGKSAPLAIPKGNALPSKQTLPQGSAFAPTQGTNQGQGIAQLSKIYEWLRQQGVNV